jgi:hypothetical protein
MARGLGRRTAVLLNRVVKVLIEIHPATVRAVSYRLFSEGLIPSMARKETSRVSRLLTGAREDGTIPWEWIVDNTRKPNFPGTYSSPMAFAKSMRYWWRQDPWEYMNARVEVWSEKDTVSGVLAPVLERYAVPFRVNRGFTSATAAHDIAQEASASDKLIVAFYVGDYDPSGLFMSEVDLPQRLEKYGGSANLDLTRIALIESDLEALNHLSFPVTEKANDPRYRWYREHTKRRRCWELDAMNPNDLRARVEAAIRGEIDEAAWARIETCDRAVQESLDAYMKRWSGSKSILSLVQKYGDDDRG